MRLKTSVFLSMFVLSLFVANTSHAGFYMKKESVKTTVTTADKQDAVTVVGNSTDEPGTAAVTEMKVHKKQGFFKRLIHKAKQAEISKGLYIILALIGLGWLGMGINDDFAGSDWIISLVLYLLFYLPGLIYTLVKMKKYY